MPTCAVQSLCATGYKNEDQLFWGVTLSHWICMSQGYQGTMFPTEMVSHPKDLNPQQHHCGNLKSCKTNRVCRLDFSSVDSRLYKHWAPLGVKATQLFVRAEWF